MSRVTGVGGIFFKAENPEALYAWYEKHLGIKREKWGVMFRWQDDADPEACTIWSIFPKKSEHFGAGEQSFMINYRVENMDALVEKLREAGVWIDPKRDNSDYGRFAWIKDPEGNRIELWEPPKPA
jgi:predicted enzyme related to lactoylglutathione lyase